MSVEPGGVPQKKIGQYWRYTFVNTVTPDGKPVTFYGFSEDEARAQFDEWAAKLGNHIYDSPVLLNREPW